MHLSSTFLWQISRAHSDQRTERRWRSTEKALQGSIAAITAGSSVVLRRDAKADRFRSAEAGFGPCIFAFCRLVHEL